MENFFQNLKRRVRENISTGGGGVADVKTESISTGGGGFVDVERNPILPQDFLDTDMFCCRPREVKWSRYRPGINIFALLLVHNHNEKENANLKFVNVVNAEFRNCGAMGYRITLKAKDGENVNVYETGIFVEAWMDWKEMLSLQQLTLSHNQLLD